MPDYYLHETHKWLVLPYELNGLTKEEIYRNKPFLQQIFEDLKSQGAG